MPIPRLTDREPAQALASFAVVGVALVAVVLAIGNLALWLYAQNTVIAAAQEAAVVASRENGTPLDGQQTARSLLVASLGSSADRVTTIDVRIDADVATAEVRGSWPVVLLGPLASAPLHATATLARERFRPGGR
jgi:uncharacterized membrane protein YqiK